MRPAKGDGLVRPDPFYRRTALKKEGVFAPLPPGPNMEAATPHRVGVRLFSVELKQKGDAFVKLQVDDGPVDRSRPAVGGRWQPWDGYQSLWVGDPSVAQLKVKVFLKPAVPTGTPTQIGIPLVIPLAPYLWPGRASGVPMPAPTAHAIPGKDGGRITAQIIVVEPPPLGPNGVPRVHALVGTWNVGNEPPPADLTEWLFVGDVDQAEMPDPPPEKPKSKPALEVNSDAEDEDEDPDADGNEVEDEEEEEENEDEDEGGGDEKKKSARTRLGSAKKPSSSGKGGSRGDGTKRSKRSVAFDDAPDEAAGDDARGDASEADADVDPDPAADAIDPSASMTKKQRKDYFAQPPPRAVDHSAMGVDPRRWGEYELVVVGCQESQYAPREGFAECEDDWLACVAGTLGDSYVLTCRHALGQMRVAFFARADVAPAVWRWRTSTEATGIGHVLANKGGVGVACRVWDTSMCFLNAHLAAHDDQCARRNDDFAEIVGGCFFGEKVECVQAFHHLVWMGDLNYRCEYAIPPNMVGKKLDRNPPRARVRNCIRGLGDPTGNNKNARQRVFETDQLTAARLSGDAFMGFEEGNPAKAHMPTFKVQREKGFNYKLQRTPAWCDRVLWKTAEGFRCELTTLEAAGDVGTSDHKPVAAGLEMDLLVHAAVSHFEETTAPDDKEHNAKVGARVGRTAAAASDEDADAPPARARTIVKTTPSLPDARTLRVKPPRKTWAQWLLPMCFAPSDEYENTASCEWRLRFTMMSGRNLVASDFGGTSDPYVNFFSPVLARPPNSSASGSRVARWRSKTITANLNPMWRCDKGQVPNLPLLVSDPAILGRSHLAFRVMDEDLLTKDDPIGYGRMWLGPLASAPLKNKPSVHDTVVHLTQYGRKAGELHVTVVLEKVDKSAAAEMTPEERRAARLLRKKTRQAQKSAKNG